MMNIKFGLPRVLLCRNSLTALMRPPKPSTRAEPLRVSQADTRKCAFKLRYAHALDCAFLAVISVVLSVSAFYWHRLIRDDWANLIALATALDSHSVFYTLRITATNEWIGQYARSFFITWWIQIFLLMLIGSHNVLAAGKLFAVFILLVHTANAFLIYKIASRFLHDRLVCLTMALAYLLLPHAVEDYMVANNWFFMLPLFFYLLFLNVLIVANPASYAAMLLLVLLLLLSMFSGEQLLMAPYLVAIGYLAILYIAKHPNWRDYLRQSIIVYGVGFVGFVVYYTIIAQNQRAKEGAAIFHLWSIFSIHSANTVVEYTRGLVGAAIRIFGAVSGDGIALSYGSLALAAVIMIAVLAYALIAIPPEQPTPRRTREGVALLGIALVAILLFVLTHASFPLWSLALGAVMMVAFFACALYGGGSEQATLRRTREGVALLGIALIAILLLMFIGALTGVRPGPESRYLLNPALIATLLIVALVSILITHHFSRSLLFSLFIGALAVVSLHLIGDLWPIQAALDRRLWQATESAVAPKTDYLLTVSNDARHPTLMPPYQSIIWTWSDFTADWGVQSILRYKLKREVALIRSAHPLADDEKLEVANYYGQKSITTADHVAVIYLNSGTNLGETARRNIEVMSYAQYLQFAPVLNAAGALRPDRLASFPDKPFIGTVVAEALLIADDKRCSGHVDTIEMIPEAAAGSFEMQGWSWDLEQNQPFRHLVFLSNNRQVIGYASSNLRHVDVNLKIRDSGHNHLGWSGFAYDPSRQRISAYGITSDNKLCRIAEVG